MSFYKSIVEKVAENPRILKAHCKALNLSKLNFQKMKDMGMENIIFAKDNVVTLSGEHEFICEDTYKGFAEAHEVFGEKNLIVVSDFLETPFEDKY